MRSLLRQQSQFVHFFVMTIILLVALFVRIYNIENAPPGLYQSEAANALHAYQVLATGEFKWFYGELKGLYSNIQAISMALFGVNTLAIKLPSILFGLLSVLGLYFLARELFPSKPRIALITAYLCAISFWSVSFSRLGIDAIALVPILCFTFYFFFRGIRTKKLHNYIFAGLICGLGLHTNGIFWVMPILLLSTVILFLMIDKYFIRLYAKGIIAFMFAALLIMMPVLYNYYTNPASIAFPDESLLFQNPNQTENLPQKIVENTGLAIGKYNFFSDPDFRHNFPPYPILEPLTGFALLGGLFLIGALFFRTLQLRLHKNVRNRNLVISGLLLMWLISFLLPELLSSKGVPSTLKSLGTLPAIFLLAAYGINTFIEKRELHQPLDGTLPKISLFTTRIVLLLFFAYLGIFSFIKYHVNWAYHPQTAEAFGVQFKNIALSTHAHPSQKTYIIAADKERAQIHIYATKTNITFLNPKEVQETTFEQNVKIYITESQRASLQLLKLNPSIPEIFTTLHFTPSGTYTVVTAQ